MSRLGQKQKEISRRRFLILCGKIVVGAMFASVIPVKLFGGAGFIMRVKPFKDRDLYRKHNLAG
ncbi:MAG: hypothetical protein JSV34_06055 [Candidatus Omnitrophota bacterium]|nr:MAG: hypothetical protein JSV34_06055 [Candidatus Omnitrophota bacterium]